MIFRYFAVSAHFSQILLPDCVQNFKSQLKTCLTIQYATKQAILRSAVPHLKIKDFGKIHTYLSFVALCLYELTFTFQIMKCPRFLKNLRYQNPLQLQYKYLKYHIQKLHYELGDPVGAQPNYNNPNINSPFNKIQIVENIEF